MTKYYDNEKFELHLGSCLDILERFPESTFDMLFADPPYHLSNNRFTCQSGKAVSVNKAKWDESKGVKPPFFGPS